MKKEIYRASFNENKIIVVGTYIVPPRHGYNMIHVQDDKANGT